MLTGVVVSGLGTIALSDEKPETVITKPLLIRFTASDIRQSSLLLVRRF
jgi:hypothetical protein